MSTPKLYRSVGSIVLSCWLISYTSCSQATESAKKIDEKPAQKPDTAKTTWLGFGIGRGQQEDSVEIAFARKQQLTHMFGDFFKRPNGSWVVVHYIFGIPEGEQNIFTATDCPPLDSATFRVHERHYWQDRNGTYYAALDGYSPQIIPVSQADPSTFQYLGFEHLAIDSHHVYQGGVILPGLVPAKLKVYTPDGQLEENWDFNTSAYLISGGVGYDPDGRRLATTRATHFVPPAGYKLAYSVSSQKSKTNFRLLDKK